MSSRTLLALLALGALLAAIILLLDYPPDVTVPGPPGPPITSSEVSP